MKLTKVFAYIAVVLTAIACSNSKNEIFVPDFDQYPLSSNTHSVVFVDIKSGEEVSNKYLEAYPFYNGYAVVKTNQGWTYVDKNFDEPFQDYFRDATHFSEGVAFTVKTGGQINAINENGEVLFSLSDIEGVYVISEDRSVYKNENQQFGLLDKDGQVVCTAKFDDSERFLKDGALMVMQKDNSSKGKEKWGVVDRNGDILIPIKYPKIKRHDKGFTIYNDSRKAAWYDLESNTVSSFDFYEIVRDGNLLCYKNKKGKYGWMTLKGVEVIAPVYDEVTLFGKHDMTFVKMRRRAKEWGVINKKSEWVLGPRFANVEQTDKYPIVGNDYKEYGVIDYDGNVLIKTNKSSIKHIKDDYYLVTNHNGETGIMKADGREKWTSSSSYRQSSIVKYRPSIMVNNNFLDIDAMCNTIYKETDSLERTTVGELLEAYNIDKNNLPKKSSNILLAEHTDKSYTIKVETDKVSAWSVRRDYWSGNVVSYNAKGVVKKYVVTVTLKSRYAKNKAEILERIKQEFSLDDYGVLKTDERSYKLTDSSNKNQTSFKISITIEE